MKDKLLRNSVNILNILCIIVAFVLYRFVSKNDNVLVYMLFMVFAVTSYHLSVHLGVGYLINLLLHNEVDYNKSWFLEKKFEDKLYKKLKVRTWKDKIPTFYPDTFSLENNAPDKILKVMCQSEIVHSIIIILSFVPIAFALNLDLVHKVFVIVTSVMAGLFDTCLVIMQRYNRPRIRRMIERKR